MAEEDLQRTGSSSPKGLSRAGERSVILSFWVSIMQPYSQSSSGRRFVGCFAPHVHLGGEVLAQLDPAHGTMPPGCVSSSAGIWATSPEPWELQRKIPALRMQLARQDFPCLAAIVKGERCAAKVYGLAAQARHQRGDSPAGFVAPA
ncbi:hypothetical protein AAFF_G00111280 [Aldrovandia affinis]|uniref:Uncharacterized protein n=1 Tax=Aldrovandia affinis TaxID=143900 RepID=A0AAD7RTI5_9TELE|nr:hypothetical protein AAFF_G00111280 [Aldrovandia affinis]